MLGNKSKSAKIYKKCKIMLTNNEKLSIIIKNEYTNEKGGVQCYESVSNKWI